VLEVRPLHWFPGAGASNAVTPSIDSIVLMKQICTAVR
jgi:hypothetical protein